MKDSLIVPVAMLTALSIYFINCLGSKAGGMLQSITLIIKLIPIILIVAVGFFQDTTVEFSLFPIDSGQHQGFFTALGAGLLATMFAYDGWMHVGTIAGELKNPKRDLPGAITIGLGAVMVVYLLINAVFLMTLPVSEISGNLNAASEASRMIFGDGGGKIVTIGIMVSVYGALNGYLMTGMRVPYAMAERNGLPFKNFFLKLTPGQAPWASGLVQLIIAYIMMSLGAFDTITNMLIFVIWTFYTMAFVAVILLRRREPEMERPYKVPLYPIVPLIAIVSGIFVLINTLFTQTLLAMIGIVITLLGIPIYYYTKKKEQNNS